MTFQTIMPKLRSREVKGTLILGLGGAAAAWAAIHIYRVRSRHSGSIPGKIPAALPQTRDGAKAVSSLEAPRGDAAAVAAPQPETQTSDWVAGTELWTESIRQAMDRKPFTMGYDKSVWTAPLLCRYLEDAHGLKVPLPRVRTALKEMGYRWKYSRYVRSGNGR